MSKKEEVLTVKETVEDVLEHFERSRSDDKFLIFKVLQGLDLAYYNIQEDKIEIKRGQLNSLPSFETITRIRRKLQAEGLYQPTDEVKEKREINKYEMRNINYWFK